MVLSILAVSSIAQGQDLSQLFIIKTRTSGFCNQTLTQAECYYHHDPLRMAYSTEDHIAKPATPAGCHKKVGAQVPSSGVYVHYNPDNESTANCSEWNQCICADGTLKTNGTCTTKMSYTECDASRANFSTPMFCAFAEIEAWKHLCTNQGAFPEDIQTRGYYLKAPMTTPKGCSVRMHGGFPLLQYKKFSYGESAQVNCSAEAQCLCKEDMTGAMSLASHVQADGSMAADAMAGRMLALENQLRSMNAMALGNKAQVGKNHRPQHPLRTDAD